MAAFIPDMRVGDEYTLKIQYPAGTNITGYKFWLTLKTNAADLDAAAALQYSTVAGDQPSDEVLNGIAYMVIPSSIMKAVVAGEYLYDVQAKKPGAAGEGIKTLLPPINATDDVVTVFQEITRAIA